MIKNVINSIVKVSNKRATLSPSTRRQWLQEITLAEHRSSDFNPKKARNKSIKGISIFK